MIFNTIKKILLWILDIFFLLMMIAGFANGGAFSGILLLIAIIITNPLILDKIPKLNWKATAPISIVLFFISIFTFPTMGNNDTVTTNQLEEVTTTTPVITTISETVTTTIAETTTITTIATTEESTTKLTNTTITTTTTDISFDEEEYRKVYTYLSELLKSDDNPSNEIFPADVDDDYIADWRERCEQYENDCTTQTAEKFGITNEDVDNIYYYFEIDNSIDLSTIKLNSITTSETTIITTEKVTEKETEPPQVVETVPIINSYVLNTSTMKFHKPSCRDVEKISQENYATFDGSRADVIAQGYSPCGHCNP